MADKTETETILIVDDCADDIFFLQRTLRRAGLNNPVVVAPNVPAAIAYLRGEGQTAFPSPGAVVLELVLAGEHGFELIKWIRGQPQLEGLPVIVLTGSIRKGDLDLARQLGATTFFPKTCNPENLKDVAAYLKDLLTQQPAVEEFVNPGFAQEPAFGEPDAVELLATLSARLK